MRQALVGMVVATSVVLGNSSGADAQVLGTFRWQLQPYCNVVNVTVTQTGGLYTLDGYDDQCGAAEWASVVGTAVPNPNGSVTLGFTIVTTPTGAPVHVQTALNLGTLGGTWSDSAGNAGTLVFTPGVGSGGTPRPAALTGIPDNSVTSGKILDGTIGGLDIDPAQVQQRIQSACSAGQLMTGVNQNGTVVCEAVTSWSGGDITAVFAGTGLTEGGSTGDVTLSIGTGGVTTTHLASSAVNSAKVLDGSIGVADIDPIQVQTRVNGTCPAGQAMRTITQTGAVTCEPVTGGAGDISAVIAGNGLTGGATTGEATLTVAFGGTGVLGTAARSDHTHAVTGALNTAVGADALRAGPSGGFNLGVGAEALRDATTAAGNTGLGARAGELTTSGVNNTFVGYAAGNANTTGNFNTIIGQNADVGAVDLSNATAVGHRARVDISDALVLGSINGVNGATANTFVGIGTTSPDAPIDIDFEPNPMNDGAAIRLAALGPVISMQSRNGTRSAPTAVRNNDVLSTLKTEGYTGTGYTFNGRAAIYVQATENWTATATGTNMSFHTTDNGTTGMTERMRITNGGRVAIGRTTAAVPLDVEGDIRLGTGTIGCVQDRDGTVLAGTCSSDARLKREIAPFPSLLDKVSRLRPVTYFWRAAEFPDRQFGSSQSFGLIAQEVEALFPDMVTTDPQGYKAVNYSKLPLVTLQAVRELADDNDALKRKLAVQDAAIGRQADELAKLRDALAGLQTLVADALAVRR